MYIKRTADAWRTRARQGAWLHGADGIVAIAPGGDVSSPKYREMLGDSVARARALVREGKGQELHQFSDYESSKGVFHITARAANYLTWFDPEGAMNEAQAIKNTAPGVPVLFIAPTADYPGLARVKEAMFALITG